ncbi:hypothetical protein LSH36_71g00005 [Paralvinella palmiformis]|uniref:Leucine-rich repeat and WD repeat-containing protein 1 WD domain-containing protein n=1 Tax=Paralvinella palmiformis TaxID=53620 RepID=A0AAD9NE80_9ANNE|nr:hypothetical protein LSH36_71g00005 [Paralvinella palmiformis]
MPDIGDYEPVHFIRCHFGDREARKRKYGDNDPRDEFTKVWKCAFEPHPKEDGKETGIVATCGGEIVCLIDCSTGKVMKRFKQEQEQFYTLAWTTLSVQTRLDGRITERKTNILAVAGYNARIFLLHPDQFLCYKQWGDGAPNKTVPQGAYYISDMKFHPHEPVWLFWTPSGPEHDTDIRKLMIFTCEYSILNLVLNVQTNQLIAGTDEGIVAWKLPKEKELVSKSNCKRKKCIEFELPVSDCEVDGLTLVSENIVACKCVEDSCVYIWNLTETLNRATNGTAVVTPLMTLEWKYTKERFIQPSSADGKLVCGDDEGNIWLYNLKQHLKKKPQQLSTELYRPSRPLIMNDVSLSTTGTFLVGVTDNNMVCIWKTTD